MSCSIKLIANIHEVPKIRRTLFPTDDNRGSDSWLQLCSVSVSPTGDTIAIANENRLVVLENKWDTANSINRFEVSFSGSVDGNDPIKTVLCLPIVALSKSSNVGPEWTCIAIGFKSGFVRFYTTSCILLISEKFHDESVCNLKCQSQHSPRPDIDPKLKPEEFHVLYGTCICVVGGSQLFSLLRECRRKVISGENIDCDKTPLGASFKKWGFTDQFLINDVAMVGLDLTNTFDHLLTASTFGGFDTKYRVMAPHNNLVITAGSKPFVGYHYAMEGGTQPVLTDVARAVAVKLKSALPTWLTGNKAPLDKEMSLALRVPETMGCRFGICDLRRTAISVILSQDRSLAAVTDTLGRIFLLDSYKGTVLRLFKGYRDAQCAFIQVPEEKRRDKRIATFLLIYTPKKGTLEIFTAQQGLKIATFSASKFGVLLYVSYGLVGFNAMAKSRYLCQFTCVLIDSDGQVKEVVIPFYFAETGKNSKRSRDLHLYKLLKQSVKNEGDFISEVMNTLQEVRTSEVHLQCLQMLATCKSMTPTIIKTSAEFLLEKYQEDVEDEEAKTLCNLAEKLVLLSGLFAFLSDDELDNGNVEETADTKLILGEKVLPNLQKLLDLSTLNEKSQEPHVTFFDDSQLLFSDYLNAFVTCNSGVNLKPNLDDTDLFKISQLFYNRYITCNACDYNRFQGEMCKSGIASNDLFKMLLHYWVNRDLTSNLNLEKEMYNLSRIIYSICKIYGDVTVEYNQTSQFWLEIRNVLADSPKPFPALTAAIVCRGVAQKLEYEKELQVSETSLDDENIEIWEKLSQENCEWMILIGKLEDVSLLNIILSNKPSVINQNTCTLPKLKHEPTLISLKYILENGRGCVSELVVKWLTTTGIRPDVLLTEPDENEPAIQHLLLLKRQFPYSLDASVILASMCWEYALAWQKNLQEFGHLQAAIMCLDCIPQAHIKQGVFNLVWNAHLKIMFESACKLVNKVGKLPTVMLCKQDTGLTDFQIELFIGMCTQFLDDFLAVVQECYNCAKIHLKYENIWENGGQPLAELALQQNHINYDLLHSHYQLSLTIEMITTFKIKHSKPVRNLFDSAILMEFFTDFQHKTQVSWHRSDAKIHVSRTQFLLKIIKATVETVTKSDSNVYSTVHVSWMSKCLSLARVWNLDVDLLKRFQVTQLFISGFDVLAEELLSSLVEMNKLGPDLLVIAGKRLRYYISSSTDFTEKITALSPMMSKYLESLSQEWCAPSDLEAILTLATHSVRCLKETQFEYKIACQLLEACCTLQDIQR